MCSDGIAGGEGGWRAWLSPWRLPCTADPWILRLQPQCSSLLSSLSQFWQVIQKLFCEHRLLSGAGERLVCIPTPSGASNGKTRDGGWFSYVENLVKCHSSSAGRTPQLKPTRDRWWKSEELLLALRIHRRNRPWPPWDPGPVDDRFLQNTFILKDSMPVSQADGKWTWLGCEGAAAAIVTKVSMSNEGHTGHQTAARRDAPNLWRHLHSSTGTSQGCF